MNNIYNTNNIYYKNNNVQRLERAKTQMFFDKVQQLNTKSRTNNRTRTRTRIRTKRKQKKGGRTKRKQKQVGRTKRKQKQGGTLYSPDSAARKIQSVARMNIVDRHLKILKLYEELPDDIKEYADKKYAIGENVNSLDYAKYTFLKAIISGNIDMINHLIDEVPIDDIDNTYHTTPLIVALTNLKDIDQTTLHEIIVLLLTKHPNINAIDIDEGNTVLHLVNNSETAKLLIQEGATVDALNKAGETPLFYAHNVKVANCLINNDADINILSNDKETPIFGLIRYKNCLDSVKLLLINLLKKNGKLSIDKPNICGNTLLHVIAKDPLLYSKLELAKFLISVGIKLHGYNILYIENNKNETPYSIFEKSDNLTILFTILSKIYY